MDLRKKVMIAVDQSHYSKGALKYAARMAAMAVDMNFVLLHIQPMVSGYITEEALKSPKARAELEALNKKNQAAALALLEDSRHYLMDMGVDADRIEIKTQARRSGVADDILNTAETEKYDAVLVGRRGISGFQQFFVGSVTNNLVSHSKQIPLWIVDGTVSSDHVLIAGDGSINSLRAIDHAAFICWQNNQIRFELLRIQPGLEDFCDMDPGGMDAEHLKNCIKDADRRFVRDFQAQALARLKESGISEAQIVFRQVNKRRSPAKAIIEEAQSGGYGTLVIGRQGMSSSRFMGSVSGTVVQKMNNGAVWIVP